MRIGELSTAKEGMDPVVLFGFIDVQFLCRQVQDVNARGCFVEAVFLSQVADSQ